MSIATQKNIIIKIILAVALVMGWSSSALAHNNLITADASCDIGSGFVINYTSTSWAPGSLQGSNSQIDILFDGVVVGSGSFTISDSSFSGSAPAPAGATGGDIIEVTALAVAGWGDGFPGGQSASAFVTLPDEVCVPGPASLGDRVWEDLNTNGIQDCVDGGANDPDFPLDGIIGNAGDAGPECNSGISEVPVNLLAGDCQTSLGQMVMTDLNGFYLFPNLDPGDYCVKFDKPPADFCDTNGFDLGEPQFTTQNAGNDDAINSDADTETGVSDPVGLAAGEANLTVDAGIVCPAKIGDRVWQDTNEDGVQNFGEENVPGVTVNLFECTNGLAIIDDNKLVRTTTTEDTMGEMNYMFGAEPGFDLVPGEYFVQFIKPDGTEFTTPNVNGDVSNSDCLQPNGVSACTTLGSRGINLNRDCGIIPPAPPQCDLVLDKTCRVEVPTTPAFDKCKGKLQQFTVAWTDGPIVVNGLGKTDLPVSNGDVITFTGPFGQNDVVINISGAQNGTSTFHMSCSDEDFNDPGDCGKAAGNGKGGSGINLWTLEGFVDAEGRVLNCGDSSDGPFTQSCSFEQGPLPSCDTTGKPDTLTWRFDGGSNAGSCDGSTFATAVNEDGKMHKDFVCNGIVDSGGSITVIDDHGGATLVNPGESFSIDLDAVKKLDLVQNGTTVQHLEFHTSCSQPIQAGLTAGGLTLEALDDLTGGANVTYQYEVINNGDPLSNVNVTDDLLGSIGSVSSLGTGNSAMFTASTLLMSTTVNVGTARGTLANGDMCSPASASDQVVVEVTAPTCAVTVALKELKDDAIKYTVTNTSQIIATLETFVLDFPAEHGVIKEVKLDGAIYKAKESNLVVSPGVTIGDSDWTEENLSKRQLDPGEHRTLEIKFTEDNKDSVPAEYTGSLTFGEGCQVDL